MPSDAVNSVLSAVEIRVAVKRIYPPRDLHYRWEGHDSERASVLNHPPVMREPGVSSYRKGSIVRATSLCRRTCHCFSAELLMRRARAGQSETGNCKISRQIIEQETAETSLCRSYRDANVLDKHLNRRGCCSALVALCDHGY